MKHIVSIDHIGEHEVRAIFSQARYFRGARDWEPHQISRSGLKHRVMVTAFFEPSTRTRLSFEAAMSYLGGKAIGTENAAEFSSIKKGESLYDNFKVISGYGDVIVGRFHNEGDAAIAASACDVPFINGGDGKGEHPTQALTDLFIIQDKLGNRESMTVTFLGDNEHSRTVHSLAKLLGRDARVNMTFLKPPVWKIDPVWNIHHGLKADGNTIRPDIFRDTRALHDILSQTDVLYLTRPQVERHNHGSCVLEHQRANCFVLGQSYVDKLPKHALILHPLPRTSELPPDIDKDPRAAYFEQARNGLYIRMALLQMLCN